MKIEIPVLDTIAEIAKDLVARTIAPSLEEVGGLLVDRIRMYRFKNQVKILSKADNYLKEHNIKTRKVNLNIMAPLLEDCSLQDDESLQEKWAALFVNVVKEDSTIESTLFSHILNQLSSLEAEIFEFIFDNTVRFYFDEAENKSNKYMNGMMSKQIRMAFEDYTVPLDNLIRLRLVKEIQTKRLTQSIMISDLGFVFMNACRLTAANTA